MKRVEVDLRSRRVPPVWAWITVLIAATVAAVLWIAVYVESIKLDELRDQRSRLLQRSVQAEPPSPTPRKMPYDASAREMLALATSDWPSMLTALENVDGEGISLIEIEIAAAEHSIRVELKFTEYSILLQYVDALNSGEPKARWRLTRAETGLRSGRGNSATVLGTY